MIDPHHFLAILHHKGAGLITGVPDSLLAGLCAVLSDSDRHLPAPNEGSAVALAAGHYLATGMPAVVYMQNSGLGNAINPLTSLADPEIYSIPMLLIIGWRGEPGVKDEPQHVKQGRVTPAMLELLDIPYRIVGPDSNPEIEIDLAWEASQRNSGPAALLIRKGTFRTAENAGEKQCRASNGPLMTREEAIECILERLSPDDMVISTTGRASRELWELRLKRGEHCKDFLTVGSMGHASAIALATARSRPDRRFICLDGDGALLMHMGMLGLAGSLGLGNFWHVVLNNFCHESVGGQPVCAVGLDFSILARSCGYVSVRRTAGKDEIVQAFENMKILNGPHFCEILVAPVSRPDLGRPGITPKENKAQFMKSLL
jgi:phosphonopyruvate decarboxylase